MKPNLFLERNSDEILDRAPVLLGLPLDLTAYKPGTRQAPKAIRNSQDCIESYSPKLDMDLLDVTFADIGDLDFQGLDLFGALTLIRQTMDSVVDRAAKPLSIGGEHTITLPVIGSILGRYPDVVVIQADAHADLRDYSDGKRISHATVMRRISELVGSERIIQLGIRSGNRAEFQWMRRHDTLLNWNENPQESLTRKIADRPVYCTLDLDVLDPSALPGTGNPELGGWTYTDLERLFDVLRGVKLIGADVVELNPTLDPTEASSIAAAKIVRELLLILGANPQSTSG